MQNSKAYYGGTLLENEDLKESNIKHKIELEYYTIKNYISKKAKDEKATYGIEIVKKEYKNNSVNTESSAKQYISNSAEKIIEIIETLKRHKVTPIGLNDVLEDLLKTNEVV